MSKVIKTKTTLTWKERIMLTTTGRNDKGGFLWYSHDMICRLISEAEGVQVHSVYRSLSCYLQGLVKSGHLERAIKPRHLSRKVQYDGKPEYLYRQTGKAFTRQDDQRLKSGKNASNPKATQNAVLSHELWRIHRGLPKWFRRMMLD